MPFVNEFLARLASDAGARELLVPLGLEDWRGAARRLQALGRSAEERAALERLFPSLLGTLAETANSDRALVNLERFIASVPRRAAVLADLAADPHALHLLGAIFAGSQFLSEILLSAPEQYPRVTTPGALAVAKSSRQIYLEAFMATVRELERSDPAAALDALRRYQHWDLLRIGAADLAGLLDLATVTEQLSRLADNTIQVCLDMLASTLRNFPGGFTVLGMGKLGGSELNYSSDVDLLFLAAGDAEEHERLGQRLIAALTQATTEGFLYRVDMRLRPWGRVGPLVSTVDGYLTYLERHARLWERQALLRARVVAGDEAVGTEFLRRAGPLLFSAGAEAIRAEVHGMKQLTESHLRQAGRTWGEVKLGEGSIRDAEFVAQYLQLAHGAAHPELRTANTPDALRSLAEAGLLSPEDHRVLSDGYTFLRTVEHYLQILDYTQTHTLPTNPADLRYLARRLGFSGETAAEQFVTHYQQHSAAIRAVYLRHLTPAAANGAPTQRGVDEMTEDPKTGISDRTPTAADQQSAIRKHLARLSPSYAATFSPEEIARHVAMAERLNDRNPVEVLAEDLGDDFWRVTVVAYDYLGELSVIAGLFFAFGMSILDGHVYTYEQAGDRSGGDARRKIVDVFTLHREAGGPAGAAGDMPALWRQYTTDLAALLRLLEGQRGREAQGELAKRVALAVPGLAGATPTLHPIEVEIDNEASDRYTVLRIGGADTIGFLYELANALALNGVHISQVSVATIGSRVQDTLHITDARGQKITSAERQRELRAATVLVKHFTHLLPHSPNPETALLHFNEYLGELFSRPAWPDELASLERPEVLDALARLLGVSEFLWDDFLRMQHANLFPVVEDVDALSSEKSRARLTADLAAQLAASADWRETLNAFKDREMFRIDMRHILGRTPSYAQFAAELSDLVETVIAAATERAARELDAQHGALLGEPDRPPRLAVCALGKCGGRELGFASDIELMFIFDGAGETAGPKVISMPEYFEKLVLSTTRAVTARREGIFEIDLQLRPYGKMGSLAVALESFRRYFALAGPAWSYERQSLVKLRPIAGDEALGRQVCALRDLYVYGDAAFDVAAMRAMRERQLRHLVTPGTLNAKFSQGGLVDVEYIVQGLQIRHGAAHPAVRVTNTADAIARLTDAGILSAENGARLHEALAFLQQLINALRMVRGNNRDLTVPPQDTEEFAFLARRLGHGADPTRLGVAISEQMAWVQRLCARRLG